MRGGGPVVRVLAAVAMVAGAGAAGWAQRPERHPRLDVSAASALADAPVRIAVRGLAPGERVEVEAGAVDYAGTPWRAEAHFDADTFGAVDLSTRAPVDGTYQGVDPMGLFWSMNPLTGDAQTAAFVPRFPQLAPSYTVSLTVYADGRQLASTTLTRTWMAPGVTHRPLTLARDGVVGDLFLPPPGARPRPAVLAFGGSEGGQSENFTAALLASHGYPALSLGYFHLPGLPAALTDVPLEYFAAAARVLAAQPGADPRHLLAMGYSRGTEAALLIADLFPSLIHGAVLYAPSANVNPAFPSGDAAWTLRGAPVPLGPIPVDHVAGPVLAIAGDVDGIWDSQSAASLIDLELGGASLPYPHRALIFPDAGHGIGTFPYTADSTLQIHPLTHTLLSSGGSRPGNEAARVASWTAVLGLLDALAGNS